MANGATSETERSPSNIIAGMIFAGFGGFLIIASQEFEDAGRSTPMFIGVGTIVLAALLILLEVLKRGPSQDRASNDGSQRRRFAFVVLMGIWVLLLPYVGFLVSGFIMFAIVAAAVPKHARWTAPGLCLHAAAGAVTTLGFWFVLTQLLSVPLPEPTIF